MSDYLAGCLFLCALSALICAPSTIQQYRTDRYATTRARLRAELVAWLGVQG